ncbi:tryptophan 2,3-dioxygenase family protein, partial [Streptomyces sp. NPDC102467]|uniref:tryptophan 2,3-dioxygenase family protein n=1 Tax=Streptomyces sp. NPDC102467 TaxID=3366179 RepID=UPI0038155CEB
HVRSGRQTAVTALRRVTAVMGLLEAHLELLDHLAPENFASFRPLVEGVSGAQSSQFAELFQQVTALRCGPAGKAGDGRGGGGQGAASDATQEKVADAVGALRAAVTRWRTRHLLLVERMIGDQPGTGGTSGLAYLRSRINVPPHI